VDKRACYLRDAFDINDRRNQGGAVREAQAHCSSLHAGEKAVLMNEEIVYFSDCTHVCAKTDAHARTQSQAGIERWRLPVVL